MPEKSAGRAAAGSSILPDDSIVLPGRAYRSNTSYAIGNEKRNNPRIAQRSGDKYVMPMENRQFPLPEKIQEMLSAQRYQHVARPEPQFIQDFMQDTPVSPRGFTAYPPSKT